MERFFIKLKENKTAWFAFAVVGLYIVCGIFGNFLAPVDPLAYDADQILKEPSMDSFFGTDRFGRDIFSRILIGTQISFKVGLISVSFAVLAGTFLGVLSGYFRGWVDALFSRVTDILFSFPDILLALIVVAILGPSLTNLMIAIGIVYTPIFARITRGATMNVKENDYIQAARALGVSKTRVLFFHILPNIIDPLLVQISLSLAFAILTEATLSFLGLGSQPDLASWGIMLKEGKDWMQQAWWMAVFPGLAISAAVLSFNFLGDFLQDVIRGK